MFSPQDYVVKMNPNWDRNKIHSVKVFPRVCCCLGKLEDDVFELVVLSPLQPGWLG